MENENGSEYAIYCSRCGAKMSSNSRYCMKCGNLNYDHEANKSMKPFIKNENPLTISINYIPGAFKTDYVFATNGKRYQQMTDSLYEIKNKDTKIIATSNVTARGEEFAYKVNRAPLLEPEEEIKDNSLLMLLKVLYRAGVREVFCAGFDGYSDRDDNYYNPSMEYSFVKAKARHLNSHMRKVIFEAFADMKVEFITYSHYTEVEDAHQAAF